MGVVFISICHPSFCINLRGIPGKLLSPNEFQTQIQIHLCPFAVGGNDGQPPGHCKAQASAVGIG